MVSLMTEEYTLSLSQIAQRLQEAGHDIAESTVRKYARYYKEYLPSRKLEGERWEKYQEEAVAVVGRIFELSNEHKSRHEIKSILNREGRVRIIDGEAEASDDTVTESAHRYDSTPAAAHHPHDDDTANLPQQYGELIEGINNSLVRSAITGIQLYRTLLEEKDYQITELEAVKERLESEKRALKQKDTDELSKVLDQVARWKAKHLDKVS